MTLDYTQPGGSGRACNVYGVVMGTKIFTLAKYYFNTVAFTAAGLFGGCI